MSHSAAHGGYWLVTGYAEVREALDDPSTYSSSEGVAFPHHQTLMMPPIGFDPPLQKDFRKLLNRHLSRAGIAKYGDAIHAIAAKIVDGIADRDGADLHSEFAAPFTAEVLARVILNVDDDDLFDRARAVASQISRNDPDEEVGKRAQLEQVAEAILIQRRDSGSRNEDIIDALLFGEVDSRPLTRDERVGTLMILVMGGLSSTTNAALTSMSHHSSMTPGLEEHLRNDDWTRYEVDEYLRFEPPVGSLSRTVLKDPVLGDKQLKRGDVVLLHFFSANRDESVFPNPNELDLTREKHPHLSFGLGNHRCIGSNLARLQIEIAVEELPSKVENIRLVEGSQLVRDRYRQQVDLHAGDLSAALLVTQLITVVDSDADVGKLDGKVVFITGAARAQGRSHAIRLAAEGADIIAIDICAQIASVPYPLATPDDLALTVKEVEALGRNIHALPADVRDEAGLKAAFDAGVAAVGPVDVVIANAGIMSLALDEPPEAWQDVIDVNLTGVLNTLELALPSMVERGQGGSIVITSSAAGLLGIGGPSRGGLAYTAAKHGVVGLMRSYANSYAQHSIRVNTVHPTGVTTPMVVNENMEAVFAANPTVFTDNALPVGRIEPIDVSNAIAWLVSDDARYVTGVTLPVDAGFANKK